MKNNTRAKHSQHTRGFSLVEMLVAITLFAIVMVVTTGALLALVDANRKAQAIQSVINNLNVSVDGMVRALRMGSEYRCGTLSPADPNCAGGGGALYFESFGGDAGTLTDDWVYWYDPQTRRLYKSENGGGTSFAITAPEVEITDMKFYVVGATRGDNIQPKVLVVIRGVAGAEKFRTTTTFEIQAAAVQRIVDI